MGLRSDFEAALRDAEQRRAFDGLRRLIAGLPDGEARKKKRASRKKEESAGSEE